MSLYYRHQPEIPTDEEVLARVGRFALPAVHLCPHEAAPFSRIGGMPHLPAGMMWPRWQEKTPLAFVSQIDLAKVTLPSFLPATGVLYFFFGCERWPEALNLVDDETSWTVLYVNQPADRFVETEPPPDLETQYRPMPIAPRTISLLPTWEEWQEAEPAARHDLLAASVLEMMRDRQFAETRTRHQLLGRPSRLQFAEMELECECLARGLNPRSAQSSMQAKVEAARAGAAQWKLLLQLDSDDDADMMWGHDGRLYFWINTRDARGQDFRQVRVLAQTY